MNTPYDEPLVVGETLLDKVRVPEALDLCRELMQQIERLPIDYGTLMLPHVSLMLQFIQQFHFEVQQVNGALEQGKKLSIQQHQVAKVGVAV